MARCETLSRIESCSDSWRIWEQRLHKIYTCTKFETIQRKVVKKKQKAKLIKWHTPRERQTSKRVLNANKWW